MRIPIILFLFLLYNFQAIGQLQPMFQTTLYFEDAVGNRDTIIAGFDTLANIDYNPQFGEVDINSPFDSVFDVRAAHGLGFGWGEGDYTLTKKIVGGSENYLNFPSCYIGETLLFFVHAKHQPITVTWEQSVFANNCLDGSFLTPDRMYQMINPWNWLDMPAIRYGCSPTTSTFTFSLGDAYRAPMEIPYIAMQAIEGNGGTLDSVYGVALFFSADWAFSPCSLVPTQQGPSPVVAPAADLFPNPAGQQVLLSNRDGQPIPSLFIYDQLGKMVLDYPVEQNQGTLPVDLSRLPPGLYFLVQRWPAGEVRVNKLVRM